MPLPPPLDFFAMQTQMDQQRRQREQDALQQMLLKDQQAERAADTAIRMREGGAPMKDIEIALGRDMSPQGFALLRITDKTLKKREAEAKGTEEAGTAQSTLAQLLTNSGGQMQRERLGTGNQQIPGLSPAMLDQLKLQMMAGGEASPASEIERMAMLAQSNAGALAAQGTAKLDFERRKAQTVGRVNQGFELGTFASKEEIKRKNAIAEEQRKKAITGFSESLAEAMVAENGVTLDTKKFAEAVAADPVLGGKNLEPSLYSIQLDALSSVRAAQPAREVAASVKERTGLAITERVANMLVDGTAVEDTFTGLPMSAPTMTERTKVALGTTIINGMVRAQVLAQKIAAKRTAGWSDEMELAGIARAVGLGPDDPDVNEYDAVRNQVAATITLYFSGQAAAEAQEGRFRGYMPKIAELKAEDGTPEAKKMDGQLPASTQRRLAQAYDFVQGIVSELSLVDPRRTKVIYRTEFDRRVAEGLREGGDGAAQPAAPVNDPRLPKNTPWPAGKR